MDHVPETQPSTDMNLTRHAYMLSNRRRFLRRLSVGAALFAVPGAFAEELFRTPPQTEGPFYPDHLPLDTDNDLLIVNDGITPAVGEVNSSRSSYAGVGIYKTTDEGRHWEYVGLPESQHIGKIQLHPTNNNIAWVAALGLS